MQARLTLQNKIQPSTQLDPGAGLSQFSAFESDPRLNAITDFAAKLCGVPIALVSLVEATRQWFPARTGLDVSETPREQSMCAHAMQQPGIMVVPDTLADPRFAANPLVQGEPNIRFYAGAPLVSPQGTQWGALCVIDRAPRSGLTEVQHQGLKVLAESVVGYLVAYEAQRQEVARSTSAEQERDDQRQRFQLLADTMPQMVWSTLPDGYHDYYNARWYEFTGMPVGSTDGELWNGMFHPDDQDRAWSIWRHSLETGEPYEIEYRLRSASGEYRWVLGRALPMRDGNGAIVRWFGTCTDMHEHKLTMDQREIVSHELSHRIKNIFAVISGLIGLSARQHPEYRVVTDELRERVLALGRAHDFVRPHSAQSNPTGRLPTLRAMLGELMSPYQYNGAQRVLIEGEDAHIDDRSATPLALTFHELATNATKYGSLSRESGIVKISIEYRGDEVAIEWREISDVAQPFADTSPNMAGFGTRLIELSIERQLGGKIVRRWEPSGLVATISIPCSAMSRALANPD
ncbi:MAG: PAS domain-containing protein [Novosphingobium sp.]